MAELETLVPRPALKGTRYGATQMAQLDSERRPAMLLAADRVEP